MGQIVAVQVEDIEHIIKDRNVHLLSFLKQRKSCDAVLESHDFSVHDEMRGLLPRQGGGDFRKITVEENMVAGE